MSFAFYSAMIFAFYTAPLSLYVVAPSGTSDIASVALSISMINPSPLSGTTASTSGADLFPSFGVSPDH
jgi:hypothetical protein